MSRRTLIQMVGAWLLLAAVVVGGASPAWAHAVLLSTQPEYGLTLSSGPGQALVHYDLPVEVRGAEVTLERAGKPVRVGQPVYASADHRDVSLPLPALGEGSYLLTWFLFGSDGDVMGGELPFTVASASPVFGPSVPAPAPSPGAGPSVPVATPTPATGTPAPRVRAFAPLSRAQDTASLLGFAAVVVLLGGVTFVAVLWPAGAKLARTRALLGGSLVVALLTTAAALGLKGAAVRGGSALGAFSPAALTALNGTHVGQALMARLGFLALAVPVVAYLSVAPRRALGSHRWWIGAVISGVGTLASHGMLSHAYTRGPLAAAADVVHLGAVSVWLGGLTMLAVVVLPRRRRAELALLVPRFSRLAFGSVMTAIAAGTALLLLISPRWTALPTSGYGRFLLLKLGLVAMLVTVASRARAFVQRRLPDLTRPVADEAGPAVGAEQRVLVTVGAPSGPPTASASIPLGRPGATTPHLGPAGPSVDPISLRPFVTAVTAELCIAASILATTALLISRAPPN